MGRRFGDTLWLSLLLHEGFVNADLVSCVNEVHFLKRQWWTETRKQTKDCQLLAQPMFETTLLHVLQNMWG